MTGIKVADPLHREGLSGEVVKLFPSCHTGIVHGDDGYDVTFSDDSLALAFNYAQMSLGLRVSYGVLFAASAKIPTAVNLKPGRENQVYRPTDSCTKRTCNTLPRESAGNCATSSGRYGIHRSSGRHRGFAK